MNFKLTILGLGITTLFIGMCAIVAYQTYTTVDTMSYIGSFQ